MNYEKEERENGYAVMFLIVVTLIGFAYSVFTNWS